MYSIKNLICFLTVNFACVNIDCQKNKVKNLMILSVSVLYSVICNTLTLNSDYLSGVVLKVSSQPNVRIWFLDWDPVTEERHSFTF